MVADFKAINAAMREYYLLQYQYGRAAYDRNANGVYYSYAAGNKVLREADQRAMEAKLTELLDPAVQAWIAGPRSVIEHLRKAAREAGKNDVANQVAADVGTNRAAQSFLSVSREAIALIDGNNDHGRAGRETSHSDLLVQARGNRMVPTAQPTGQPQPAPAGAPAGAAPAGAVMHGTSNMRYGELVSITPQNARHNARLVILSANFNGNHFNNERVNEILSRIPVKGRYPNDTLRALADEYQTLVTQSNQLRAQARPPLSSENIRALTTQANEARQDANAVMAVIGVLTLENRFARARAAGDTRLRAFANNDEVVSFYQDAVRRAGTYSIDDQSVAPAGAAGGQDGEGPGGSAAPAAGGGAVRKRSMQKQFTPIDPAVQLALERLGMDTGQPGTDGPNQFDATGASTPDGKRGQFTNKAIEDFRARDPKYKDMSEEDLFKEIIAEGAKAKPSAAADAGKEGAAETAEKDADPAVALAAIVAGLKGVSGDDLDVRTTNEFQIELAASEQVTKEANPIKRAAIIAGATNLENKEVAASIKKSAVATISAALKSAGVDQDKIDAFTGNIDVDLEGRIKGKSIKALELFAGRRDANETYDAVDMALLDDKTPTGKQAIPLIAQAIQSGKLSV